MKFDPEEAQTIWRGATDDELLEAAYLKTEGYSHEALEVIKEELRKRGLENPSAARIHAIQLGDRFKPGGKPLKCVVCGEDRFQSNRAQLNTSLASFFGMDWLNRSALCLTCTNCGYIHWFRKGPGVP